MKKVIPAVILASSLIIPATTFAASLGDVVNRLDSLINLINRTVTATVTSVSGLLYEANPSLPATMTANLPQNQAKESSETTANNIILPQIKQDLLQQPLTGKDAPAISLKYLDKEFTYKLPSTLSLANKPASDFYLPPLPGVAKFFQPKIAINFDAGNANMNFNSLLNPLTYSTGNLDTAMNFISYTARLDLPLMDPAMSWENLDDDQKKELMDTEAGIQYRVALRSLIANRSVALDNLYSLVSQRIPQSDLSNRIPGKQEVSPLALEKYMSTRRTDSQTWYASMQKAAPATVAREQLFVMAEVEKLLFQMHQDNQRILATLSMMQLFNTNQARMNLRTVERKAASAIDVKLGGEPDAEAAIKAQGLEVPKTE